MIVVFLGPTLPVGEAKKIVKADYRPPARQGDVFRALVKRPTVIVLIDGVFEGVPSVWHHELRAALAAGVTVFGASSMGALRAVELQAEGMIGVGSIFRGYRDGELVDDGDVALLHADASHGFKPMTVPLVNVLATVEAARRAKVVTPREAKRLVATARATFFQDRTWHSLGGSPRFAAWLRTPGTIVDQKAADARECLQAAKAFVAGNALQVAPKPFVGSSFVRRSRWLDAHSARIAKAQRRANRRVREDNGSRRLLLASFAKASGLAVTPTELAKALRRVPAKNLAADERAFIAEVIALEAKVLATPERFVADGPSRLEGLAIESVLAGDWA